MLGFLVGGNKKRATPFGRVTKTVFRRGPDPQSATLSDGADLPVASGARLLPLERLAQPAGSDESGAGPVLQAAQGDLLQEEVASRFGEVARGDRLRLTQNLFARGADQPVQFAALNFAPQLRTENADEKMRAGRVEVIDDLMQHAHTHPFRRSYQHTLYIFAPLN